MTGLDIALIIAAVVAIGAGGFFYIKNKGIGSLIDIPSLLEKAVTELEGHLTELDGDTMWERKLLMVLDRLSDKSPLLEKAITQLREGKTSYAIKNFRKAIDEMRAKVGK